VAAHSLRHLPVDAWITREFAARSLAPPRYTPEALARALERERQITIVFRVHASDDPRIYGLLYRTEGFKPTYIIILIRPTRSILLRRLTVFHELAHILFDHPLMDVAGMGRHAVLVPGPGGRSGTDRPRYGRLGAGVWPAAATAARCKHHTRPARSQNAGKW
jgi:hypothetical protein